MIVEYLTQFDFGAGSDERPKFTVNNLLTEVALVAEVTGPKPGTLRNGKRYRLFQANDNVRLLSIGLVLPYSYTISTYAPEFAMTWQSQPGVIGPIYELTGDNIGAPSTVIPFDGAEFPVDITIAHKSPGIACSFVINPVVCYVSMVNSPTALNGTVLHGWFFVKLVHSLPMVTG
jgi:hypothetical protein